MSAPVQSDAPEIEPEAPEAAAEQPEATPDEGAEIDWKAMARKHEAEAKRLRKQWTDVQPALSEHQQLLDAQRTAEERLTEEVKRATDRANSLLERTVSAEARAALAGIPGADTLVEELNLSRFISADGEIDSDAIAGLRTKFAAIAPQGARAMQPNPAQGAQPAQIDPAQIAAERLAAGDVKGSIAIKAQQALDARQAAGL